MYMKKPSYRGKPCAWRCIALTAALLATVVVLSCSGKPPDVASAPTHGPRFALALTPGPEYTTTTRWFIFTVPIAPQIACWLETSDGRYMGTIFVTAKGAKKAWMSAPATGRPEALPVWSISRRARRPRSMRSRGRRQGVSCAAHSLSPRDCSQGATSHGWRSTAATTTTRHTPGKMPASRASPR